jgi:hypothetical protein
MAKTSRTKARKLLLRDGWRGKEYAGTRAQLIEVNLATLGDFPGDPQCPHRVAHSFERDGCSMTIRVRSFVADPITYILCIREGTRVTRLEQQRNDRAAERDADKRAERERAESMARKHRVEVGDEDWPPHVAHNPAITIGDGTCFHYLAPPDAMQLEGLLEADEIPGNPACKYKFRTCGFIDGRRAFQAVRLGNKIALTVLTNEASIIRCPALKFTPQ